MTGMNPHAALTARTLYERGALTVEQAAAYLGWSPARIWTRFGPPPTAAEPAPTHAD